MTSKAEPSNEISYHVNMDSPSSKVVLHASDEISLHDNMDSSSNEVVPHASNEIALPENMCTIAIELEYKTMPKRRIGNTLGTTK